MRACVIFDSRYGNTEKIARSLSAGLEMGGIEASCANTKDVVPGSLEGFDLLCVGAPTEWLTASGSMKDFLRGLRGHGLSGKLGFAFDTRLGRPLSGSASGFIEKELRRQGLRIVAQRESAIVYAAGGGMSTTTLNDGEADRFKRIGADLAARLGKA